MDAMRRTVDVDVREDMDSPEQVRETFKDDGGNAIADEQGEYERIRVGAVPESSRRRAGATGRRSLRCSHERLIARVRAESLEPPRLVPSGERALLRIRG